MAESDFVSTIITHAGTFLAGSGLTGALVKRHFDKKERERKDSEEARKLVLKLLPALQIAQREYTRFLSESIYLHDIESEIYNSMVTTISVCKPNAALVMITEDASLHLLKNRFVLELAGHKARMQNLASELSEKQSSLNHDYANPEDLALAAKDHLDRNLADLVLSLHHLRRDITVKYLDKGAWPNSEKRLGAELAKMRRQAYSETNWEDHWIKFKDKLQITRSNYRRRFRRWLRGFRTSK